MTSFASDINASAHPKVIEALIAADEGHAPGDGEDRWTKQAEEKFREVFGPEASTFFVLSGTGSNVTALRGFLRSYESVVCADIAHINASECAAKGADEVYVSAYFGNERAVAFYQSLGFRSYAHDLLMELH